MREKMWTFLLIFTKQNNKRGLIQITKQYTLKLMMQIKYLASFQGVTANMY